MKPVIDVVDELLAAGVNVTVYNGQLDLIVDTIGELRARYLCSIHGTICFAIIFLSHLQVLEVCNWKENWQEMKIMKFVLNIQVTE